MRFRSPSPEATRAAARALAAAAGAEGLVVALSGPLGAGKTVFVKGLAEGLGIDPGSVASPTFVIASEYAAARGWVRRLAHVDLYRVESADELDAAGFPDLLEPGSLVAVEWADRLPEALPADRLEIRIRRTRAAAGARASDKLAAGRERDAGPEPGANVARAAGGERRARGEGSAGEERTASAGRSAPEEPGAGGERELSVEARGSSAEAALGRWRGALAAGGEIGIELESAA